MYPFFLEFLKKGIGSASKMNYFGLKLGKVFRKLATLISPPFSKSHHPGQPTVLKQIIPSRLERYSSHWHFLCMSILFNLFIYVNRRKLALNWLAWLCEVCSSALTCIRAICCWPCGSYTKRTFTKRMCYKSGGLWRTNKKSLFPFKRQSKITQRGGLWKRNWQNTVKFRK